MCYYIYGKSSVTFAGKFFITLVRTFIMLVGITTLETVVLASKGDSYHNRVIVRCQSTGAVNPWHSEAPWKQLI